MIFGICSSIEADPTQFDGPPYLAAVVHGDRVVGAAIRTPPWRLVLSEMDHPGAVHQLVEDLAGHRAAGRVGPVRRRRGTSPRPGPSDGVPARGSTRHERAFRLTHVIPPRPPRGDGPSEPGDRDLLIRLAGAFLEEALMAAPDQDSAHGRSLDPRRRAHGIYLWIDDGRAGFADRGRRADAARDPHRAGLHAAGAPRPRLREQPRGAGLAGAARRRAGGSSSCSPTSRTRPRTRSTRTSATSRSSTSTSRSSADEPAASRARHRIATKA